MSLETEEGFLTDYISGAKVKATPEEVEAVQVFSRQLVEDYGYSKNQIQTRPQYRVKASPSDAAKSYPVDIIVFSNRRKSEDAEYIVVECKKKTRRDGLAQLHDYLRLCNARLGVWFNGLERIFVKKIEKGGRVSFVEIPNIPNCGQRVEDIGMFKRKDLKPTHNLKVVFSSIRNYLAGNATGTTRDEAIARVMINLIFCKIFDERFTRKDDMVSFRVGEDEPANEVRERIDMLFMKVKQKYKEVLDVTDVIALDDDSLRYAVGELQQYSLTDSERDVVADAFETFICYALKGGQGQFFTPRNVVKLMVEIVDPRPDEIMIDPACGAGGFLVESLRHIWTALRREAEEYDCGEEALEDEKRSAAIKCIRGIEKDDFLCKVTKAYMAILGDGKGGVFCENSLLKTSEWGAATRQSIHLGSFDVLLANPPFGKDIKVRGRDVLEQYDLAHVWKKDGARLVKTSRLETEKTIQILFVERCLALLKDGGRMGLILPETYFHAPKMRYVFDYMVAGNNVQWVIDLPHNTFRPHNNAKCIIIILQKGRPQQGEIKMAVAEEIGHNHQGKELFRWDRKNNRPDRSSLWDDIPLILEELRSKRKPRYTFAVKSKLALEKSVLVPRYFWEDEFRKIKAEAATRKLMLVSIQQLMDEGVLLAFDGHGSPEAEYKGRGTVPYVRVKDIVNWEIYKDPTALVPEGVYRDLVGNKKVEPGDVAYVRRGSYRIGSVAMVSPFDIKAVYTREILFFRILQKDNKYGLTPYYLLYLMSHDLVARQTKNKIFIETTLPNIGERIREIRLPLYQDVQMGAALAKRIKSVMDNKWRAIKEIAELKAELGYATAY